MLPQVYKSVELNIAHFGHFNKNEYEVFEHLISKINGRNNGQEYLLPEQLQRKHILTAQEFSEMFEITLAESYRVLKEAVDRLMEKSIRIQRLNGRGYKRINVCSSAEYNIGEGCISVNFTDEIMPYLAQLHKRYILYNLKDVTGFDSLYSIRLYQLIQEFKETGWMLKSVDQLREAFGVPADKLKTYNDFKKRTFDHACTEINKRHNLEIRFEEQKKKRKVIAVKFFFAIRRSAACISSRNDIKTITQDQLLIVKLSDESREMQSTFSPHVIQDLRNIFQLSDVRITEISDKYPESRVVETIELIKSKIARKEKIGSLVTCLRENLKGQVGGNFQIPVTDPQEEICGNYKSEVKKAFPFKEIKEVKEVKKEKLTGNTICINRYLEAQQDSTWRNICELLVKDLGEWNFIYWICKTSFEEIKEDTLILKADTQSTLDWIESQYTYNIVRTAKEVIPAIEYLKVRL